MAEEEQQQGQTVTAPTERLVDILAQMREARRAYDASELTVDDYFNRIIELDQKLTLRLADNFNLRSGIRTSLPESQRTEEYRQSLTRPLARRLPSEDAEQAFIDRIRRRSDAPADFFKEENEDASGRIILQRYLEGHPQLSGLTYEDAVAIADDSMPEEEFERKYGDIDFAIIGTAIVAVLQTNKDRLTAERPEIQTQLTDEIVDNFTENLMTNATEDSEFLAWEEQKREQILSAITRDRDLMRDIAALKPLLDCTDERDFLRQHRLRESIAEDMTDIYRRVYDVRGLNGRSVLTTYAPMERASDDRIIGLAGGIPGIRRDDYAIIRNTLYRELLEEPAISGDRDITSDYLQTVMEELRHSVDLNYTDRLVNDQIPEDHPAFRHTNLILLNRVYYAEEGEGYSQQYVERTAKESARLIAEEVMDALPQPSGTPQPGPGTPEPVTPRGRP